MYQRRLSLLIAIIICALAATHVRTASAEGNPDKLVFRLETGKHKFSLYEPVTVTYSLANPTDSTIKTKTRMGYDEGYLNLFIQFGNSEPVRWGPGVIADIVGESEVTHPPNRSTTADTTIFYNYRARGLAFPKLGQYVLSGRIFLGNLPKPVYGEANPLKIEVVEPTAADHRLMEFLGSENNLIDLLRDGGSKYCKGDGETKCIADLRQVTKEFPDSAYAPYIAHDLASSVGWDGPTHPAQYKLETEILSEILDRWPNHPLEANVTGLLAYALHKAGNDKEAMEWVERFERKYPERRSPRSQIQQSNVRE